MPTLADYLRLAPFSVDELVDAANSVLRERPALRVSRRTVRYYVGVRVLPPPSGPPKHARYGADHLVRLVAARALGDAGRSLEAIRAELDLMPPDPAEAARGVQALLEPPAAAVFERAAPAPMAGAPPSRLSEAPALPSESVRRVRLGRLVVEAPPELDDAALVAELRDALSGH